MCLLWCVVVVAFVLLLFQTRLDEHAMCMSTPRGDAMQPVTETNWCQVTGVKLLATTAPPELEGSKIHSRKNLPAENVCWIQWAHRNETVQQLKHRLCTLLSLRLPTIVGTQGEVRQYSNTNTEHDTAVVDDERGHFKSGEDVYRPQEPSVPLNVENRQILPKAALEVMQNIYPLSNQALRDPERLRCMITGTSTTPERLLTAGLVAGVQERRPPLPAPVLCTVCTVRSCNQEWPPLCRRTACATWTAGTETARYQGRRRRNPCRAFVYRPGLAVAPLEGIWHQSNPPSHVCPLVL